MVDHHLRSQLPSLKSLCLLGVLVFLLGACQSTNLPDSSSEEGNAGTSEDAFPSLTRDSKGTVLFVDLSTREQYVGQFGESLQLALSDPNIGWASLSPDGDQIAYLAEGQFKIYDVESKTTRIVNESPVGSYESGQAWSPDEKKLAFDCTTTPEKVDLCIIDIESGHVNVLVNYDDSSPNQLLIGTWSHDGNWIVLVYGPLAEQGEWHGELQLINVHSGEIKSLIDEKHLDQFPFITSPSISPDGNTILFQANVNSVPEIFSMITRTGEITQLTRKSQYGVIHPIWGPMGDGFIAAVTQKSALGEYILLPTLFSPTGEIVAQWHDLNGWVIGWSL